MNDDGDNDGDGLGWRCLWWMVTLTMDGDTYGQSHEAFVNFVIWSNPPL